MATLSKDEIATLKALLSKMEAELSASSDSADARWTVRGVDRAVRAVALRSAISSGVTVGEWVSAAILNAEAA